MLHSSRSINLKQFFMNSFVMHKMWTSFINLDIQTNISLNFFFNQLQLEHVVGFGLVWEIVNYTLPLWFENVNICNVNHSMGCWKTIKFFETSHDLNQVLSFWPCDLILKYLNHNQTYSNEQWTCPNILL